MVTDFQVRPPLSGQLTRADGEPVADAEVTVETWSGYPFLRHRLGPPMVPRVVRTDAAGRWSTPRATRLTPFIAGVPEGPSWGTRITFRKNGQTLDVDPPSVKPEGSVVEKDGLRARIDPRDPWDAPRVLPAVGVLFGRPQIAAAYGGGLFVLTHRFLRTAARADGELGVRGAALFAGAALGAPTRELNAVNVDVGVRAYRPWADAGSPRSWLGPAISFELLSFRFLFTCERRATGAGWNPHVMIGFGYM